MSSTMRTVRLLVTGLVQGVGFRAFVARQAQTRGLRGWVRNRRGGGVEAVVAGAPSLVEEVVDACRRGPPASRVDRVDVDAAEGEDEALGPSFEIRPTL